MNPNKQISINSKIIIFFVLWGILLMILLGDLLIAMTSERALGELQNRRYQSRILAEELRRSSDDLTRMARTYVVTGDPRFLSYFKQIVAIRDGRALHPEHYENIHWDFVTANKDYQFKTAHQLSIIDEMKTLNFSKMELALLIEAKQRSDDLIKMETQAFKLMQGLYLAEDGVYSPNQKLAREILFSDDYHQEKAAIMEKINTFLTLLHDRTIKEVELRTSLQTKYLGIALLLAFSLFLQSAMGYWFFRKDVAKPLKNLFIWIRAMKSGKYHFDPEPYKNDEIGLLAHTFSDMAEQVSKQIHNLEYVSRTDPLTKLNNRITLNEALQREMSRFERYGTRCSVFILDIDHFKKVNDRFGHLTGDKVLTELADILSNRMRKQDVLGRWGGEEFLIIAPHTDLSNARTFAELIRKSIDQHQFDEVGHITVSIGISEFKTGASIKDVINNADKSLYKAKAGGRNRVG